MLALVFVSVVVNYMDRSNISVAAFAMSDELEISSVQMGYIFSAFSWTYVALQIPGGIFADRVKPRILYTALLALWSAATLVQAFVSSVGSFIGIRMSIGVFEAPSFPANNRIVTSWFPSHERASAIAMYTSGQFLGLAFLTPLLLLIQNFAGWRGLFVISGLIGLVWAGVWYAFYRDPRDHPKANPQEIDYIADGGGLVDYGTRAVGSTGFRWSDLGYAFVHRKLWGLYLGQFCMGGVFVFFLTWFPTYLVKYRGFDFVKTGALSMIPFLAAFTGVLLSGFLSDHLARRGCSPGVARKTPVLCGLLLSVTVIAANYTDSTFLVTLFLSIAFFGNGLASIGWVFISLMAPKSMIGLVGGVFNCIGGLSAILVPIIIGYLVKDGDFRPALFLVGFQAAVGFLSYLFIVGKVERIPEPAPAP